ncbi:hypothetical protein [Streptomyces sp. NPDC051561]|uniref:hypothetical protein n=1 Tax=Streptomyces sp. NPDC051561 TaxID=3365658 RepID=UPI00379075DD
MSEAMGAATNLPVIASTSTSTSAPTTTPASRRKRRRPAGTTATAAALLAFLTGTTLTACGTEQAGSVGSGGGSPIVCPDGSTPNPATTGGSGEDLTSEDAGGAGSGEDLTSDDVGGTGEDLTSDPTAGAGTGEDLTSEDVGGAGEDLTSEDVGGAGEDLTSDPGAGDADHPEGPSECWGPEHGGNQSSTPPRVNGVPTVGAHRWYGMKTEFTTYLRSTPSKTDDALAEGLRMVKIRLPETSRIMEARIASDCGPMDDDCAAQIQAFANWRKSTYNDQGHVVLFGGGKIKLEQTW